MSDVHRLPVPAKPPATIRRGTPQPFQRPSVSIGGAAQARREWRTVLACRIAEGDILPGVGRVHTVDEHIDADRFSWVVTVRGGVDNLRVFNGHEPVLVFTAADE